MALSGYISGSSRSRQLPGFAPEFFRPALAS